MVSQADWLKQKSASHETRVCTRIVYALSQPMSEKGQGGLSSSLY